jgi:rubrerythrin
VTGTSRRSLLAGGALAAGLLAAAGAPAAGAAPLAGDPGLLSSALQLERLVVLGYEQLLDGGWLSGPERALARGILAQERMHARTLEDYMVEIAAPRPPAPRSAAPLQSALPGLSAVSDARSALTYAAGIEELSVYGYHSIVGPMSDDKLVQTALAILCDEGQHLAIVRERLGLDPVPSALTYGQVHPTG